MPSLYSLLLVLSFVAPAGSDPPASIEREARHVETMLIAPCCWMQPVSQHQSPASDEVKKEIRQLLAAGNTRQQVLDTFVAQYGERILVEPRLSGFGAVLYAGLALSFVLSAVALVFWVRRAARRRGAAPAAAAVTAPEDAAYAARLDDELRDLD
jgi:cytochrome c-type biogenesis protein CcmH